MYSTIYSLHKIMYSHHVLTFQIILKFKKMTDDEIIDTINRINILIKLRIYLMRLRLAGFDMELNKYMRMYNGNKKELVIMYQNVPGTLSKSNMILTITSLLHRCDPDILALAEPSTEDIDIDWHPYSLVPGYIKDGKKIRLNLLVKNNIKFKVSHWNVEIPHVILGVEDWSCCFLYREWAKEGDQMTKSIQHQMGRWRGFSNGWGKERGKKKVVMGDMNFDFWSDTGSQKQLRGIKGMVMDEIISEGWYQLVDSPTRYQNLSKSCLDHIYVRSSADVKKIHNDNQTGYDHNCVGLTINLSKHFLHPHVTTYRDVSGITLDDFHLTFSDLDLAGVQLAQDANEAAEYLTHYINVTLNELAPLKKRVVKMRTSAHWMTPELGERIKKRNAMRVVAITSARMEDWKAFKVYRNTLKSDMMKRKREWIRAQLTRQNTDPKSRWRAIKNATEGKRNINDITINANGKILHDPADVASHLNSYYIKKVQDIIDVSPPDPSVAMEYVDEYVKTLHKKPPDFEFQCVSPYEVGKIVQNLKATGAVGHDLISTQVIKKFSQVLVPYITKVVNLSIMSSTYPQIWKHGIISPVPKGGDLTLDKNWRPVTLLPVMSKILETVLNAQLKNHMEVNGILCPDQHAYRKGKSTQTAWSDLDTRIQKAVDAGRYVGLLLVDMSAAFNLVDKSIIIPKVKKLGVGEYAAKLLFSYLTSRKSRTKVKGVYSAWVEVKTGIGEGSVLGPLVFILTIVCCTMALYRVAERLRSLSYTVQMTPKSNHGSDIELSNVKFADDVTGLAVGKTEDQVAVALEIMMEEYEKYFASHGLKINVSKCEHLIIGGPRTRTVTLGGRKEAEQAKLLGLHFSNQYKFEKHVDVVTRKIAMRNGQLAKLSGIADAETMRTLANATVMSTATYGCHVYAQDEKQMNRVQVKLNKTMRMVTGARMRVHISELLNQMKWMRFSEMVQWTRTMMLWRIVMTSSAPYCKLLMREALTQTRYVTREVELKIAWRPRLARKGEKSFMFNSVKLFNQMKLVGKVMKITAVSKYVKAMIKSWRKN